MDCFTPRRFSYSLISAIIAIFWLFSFPAFSAEASFNFIEFNISFVLGLTLPVLLVAVLMKPTSVTHWVFPTLLSISVLSLLFSLTYIGELQTTATLSFSVIFLALIYLWPLFNELSSNNNAVEIKSIRTSIYLINIGAVFYLLCLWFTPQINAYFGWAIINFVLLIIGLIQVAKLSTDKLSLSLSRLILPWVLGIVFSVTMFFWLTGELQKTWIVVLLVITFVAALTNGNWLLLQQIINSKPTGNAIEHISQEELFAFTHDPATNLPNYQQALKCFELKQKSIGRQKLAAVVLKPINFQQVNSVLGHHNSDILLLQLAYCLQKKVAENVQLLELDSVGINIRLARLQSLHFLVVVDVSNVKHDRKSVIDELCQQLSMSVPEAMSFKSFSLNFELAFGIAFTGEHGDNAAEVIEHATDALLLAENQQLAINYYDHGTALYTERQLLNMEVLKQDLADDNLYWYLQPQINLNDKNIKGFELMVHWYNGGDKPLELHEFIEIAEYSGDVYYLTQKMITQACSALFNLSRFGIYQPVSINLSSTDLLEPELVDYIEKQAEKFAVSTKYLIVELSESVMLSANVRAKSMIDQLKASGVGIAIDNFSGSYESLRYLRKMSINQVKIDCQYLGNTDESRAEKAIVNALVNLAKTMKLPLVGIGIDNSTVEQTFISMGGDIAQGTFIKQGIVFDELEIWIKAWFRDNPNAKPH
ncbi:MAG: EAL domain-containing protein [Colwellia sp.]|nr:EAL domain-containing protein [Colwellia sp.]